MIGIILAGIGAYIGFGFWTSQKYRSETGDLKVKQYPLSKWMGMGFYILDHSSFEKKRKPNYDILQLHGRQAYKSKLRLFEAEKLTLVCLIVFLTMVLSVVLLIKSGGSKPVDTIEKATYGNGDQTYRYAYELIVADKKTQESLDIVVPEAAPSVKEKKDALKTFITELPTKILGENDSFSHVNWPLKLIKSDHSAQIKVVWESGDGDLLRDDGEIRYNNVGEAGEGVQLFGHINCYGLTAEVVYDLVLYPKALNSDQKRVQTIEGIKDTLSYKALIQNPQNDIRLPNEMRSYDATMKWYDGKKSASVVSVLVGGVVIAICFYQLKIYELKGLVKKREEALLRAFPSFINKFTLLMNAGMTFNRAWEKIAADYEEIRKNKGLEVQLYEEMRLTLEDIGKGMSESKAYEAFGQRCKIPEILRFTALIVQNIKKGSHLLNGALQQQSKEALAMRQDLARKKGEKASTKLILPMGIMFIAILIIVITPAIITLKL